MNFIFNKGKIIALIISSWEKNLIVNNKRNELEGNVTLQCSLVHAINESSICKTKVVSNDQRVNNSKDESYTSDQIKT